MPFLSDDFLGATSSSRLNLTPPLDNSSTRPPITPSAPAGAALLSPVPSPAEERDAALSGSSDSVSLPTQVSAWREPVAAEPVAAEPVAVQPVATELAEKLTDASLEDAAGKMQAKQRPGKRDSPEVTVDGASVRPSAPTNKPDAAKEEGLQDLRVFELNSDSGKSSPSNNGKKGEVTSGCSSFVSEWQASGSRWSRQGV